MENIVNQYIPLKFDLEMAVTCDQLAKCSGPSCAVSYCQSIPKRTNDHELGEKMCREYANRYANIDAIFESLGKITVPFEPTMVWVNGRVITLS